MRVATTMAAGFAALAALLAASGATPAAAQDAFAGTWVIRRTAAVAPWVPQGTTPQADSYQRRLLGGRVTIGRASITGPAPLPCRGPHYATRNDASDMLFQGTLTDPDRQATALGFVARPIRTLETGCANELEYHMLDDDTMVFGLNNRLYTLDRVVPSPRR
jgi:hypothetical protein